MNRYLAIAVALLVIWIQHDVISDRTAERDTAVAELYQARQEFTELAVERAAADRRNSIVQSSRESIITAPATDDGDVAPVLWQGLRAADEIGEIR